MRSTATTPDEYIASLPEERQGPMSAIRDVINQNIPTGFKEGMGYGMMGWSVPHDLYPPGYHCDAKQPLPFMGLASQKNNITLYSMCVYGNGPHLEWFKTEWPKHTSRKLDMGKSCIHFKKLDDIPLKLIGELASRVTPAEWIQIYEKVIKR